MKTSGSVCEIYRRKGLVFFSDKDGNRMLRCPKDKPKKVVLRITV